MPGKILVIDDDSDIVMLVVFRLKAHKYEVIEASLGRVGLEKAQAQKPDIILLDIMMPEMDGYETLQKLKSDPRTASIPVLMFTAKSQAQDIRRALDLGAAGYIIKPFEPEEMLSTIKKVLRQ